MNQSQSKTIRYVVAGFCGLALLMVIGWLVLREPPPASDPPPARAATAAPRAPRVAPLFTPDEDVPREPLTNQVAESATTNANAAAFYRQAFALYDALTQKQKDLIGNWRTNVDSSVAAELCEKVQPICDLMHQATAVTNCDWGQEQPIATATLLPDLNHSRNLARAAVWSVAHCRTGDPPAAVDDLVAASRLGQNISSPTLIGHLVDLAVQGLVIDSVTEHASLLVSAGDARLVEQLNDRNYDEGLRRAFEQEADMTRRKAEMLAGLSPEEAMRELKSVTSFVENKSELESMEPAQAIADMRQVAELQRQYAQALGLTEAKYREWLARLQADEKANPFVQVLVTPLEQAVTKTQSATVMSAMAVAGLAVMQGGPDVLQSYPDPSTGQPFAHTRTTDGFALESSFQFLGKPMKLSFK